MRRLVVNALRGILICGGGFSAAMALVFWLSRGADVHSAMPVDGALALLCVASAIVLLLLGLIL